VLAPVRNEPLVIGCSVDGSCTREVARAARDQVRGIVSWKQRQVSDRPRLPGQGNQATDRLRHRSGVARPAGGHRSALARHRKCFPRLAGWRSNRTCTTSSRAFSPCTTGQTSRTSPWRGSDRSSSSAETETAHHPVGCSRPHDHAQPTAPRRQDCGHYVNLQQPAHFLPCRTHHPAILRVSVNVDSRSLGPERHDRYQEGPGPRWPPRCPGTPVRGPTFCACDLGGFGRPDTAHLRSYALRSGDGALAVVLLVLCYRRERNAARISSLKSCGCSQAAKWPPLSTSL
jgi:hypothetical protein